MNFQSVKLKKLFPFAVFVSLSSLLLLLMPTSKEGILETAFFIILGAWLVFFKKPQDNHGQLSLPLLLISVVTSVYFTINFYERWTTFTPIRLIASKLHLPVWLIVTPAAIILGACALYVLAAFCKQIRDSFCSDKPNASLYVCAFSAAATVIITQFGIDTFAFSMGISKFTLNVLIVLIPIFILSCIFSNVKIPILLTSTFFLVISIINAYVYSFRTRMLEPTDVYSFGTAMNVIDNYSLLPIPTGALIALAAWILLIVCVFKAAQGGFAFSIKKRLAVVAFCIIGAVISITIAPTLPIYHWQRQGAYKHGYILDFASKLQEITMAKPDGYSTDNVVDLSEKYTDQKLTDNKKPPHLIVIMDEAYSDLNVLGELSTNQSVAPFISSLTENTVSGYALASVYGGNTANSEYEFLTGNSMAWLSPNSVPYQQYVTSPTYSIISYLKTNYNYKCIAMHPHYSSGWNRPVAYGNFGFDEMIFEDGFPKKDYIRKYVSDKETFETLIDYYEQSKQSPLFMFCITMQNHGNYAYTGDNFTQSITLSGYSEDYPDVEQYLSLIHETDRAVEYLISYFSNAEDDVVILFFGDHQPILSAKFYTEISDDTASDLEKQQTQFKVPFFVWANYEIKEKQVECTSLNYLSNYLFNAAGLPLPPYNQFLSEMEGVIEAINTNGFYSKSSQAFVTFESASAEEKSWLSLYKQLQYNNAFDKKNRNESMFPILRD